MIKIVFPTLVAILVLARPDPAWAQGVGAFAGVRLASIQFDDDFAESTPTAAGVLAGGYVTVRLPSQFGMRAEGAVTLDRATIEDGPLSRFRYLEVPILLRRAVPGLPAGGQRPVMVEGGVIYRRLLDATESIGGETYSIRDGVRANDLAIGVGGEVPIARLLSISGRYVHAQHGVLRRINGSHVGRWRVIQITLQYAFKP